MGIIAKQSFLNAIYTYTGIILGFVTTILLYPHILEPDQYGLTRILIAVSVIGAQFAHLGIRNLVIRFFPFFKNPDKKHHGLLFWSLLIPLIGFILFSILFFIFRDPIQGYYLDRSPLFVDFFFYVLPITFFILYYEVLNSYLRSLRDSTTGSLVSEVLLRVAVILVLAAYFFNWINFHGFIILFTIAYGLQPAVLLAVLYRKGELHLTPDLSFMRRSLVRGMASYGLFTLLGGLTTIITWNVDVIMLGSLSGLEQTAIYAIAFYIGSVITVPQRSIEKIATPLIAEYIKLKEWQKVESIYHKTCLNQLIAGSLILALVWVNLDHVFSLMPDIYSGGRWVVLFIGLGKLFDMATGTNGSIIITSKFYRVDLYTNILLVIFTIGTNLILIPIYGINGAAIATMISIFLYNLIKFIFVWVKFSMQPVSTAFVSVVLLAFGSVYITNLVPDIPMMIPDLLLKSAVILILFLLPVWWLKLSPDLNRLIDNTLNLHKNK